MIFCHRIVYMNVVDSPSQERPLLYCGHNFANRVALLEGINVQHDVLACFLNGVPPYLDDL